MQVGIVGQRGRDRAVEVTASVRDELEARGVEVVLDEATASALDVAGVPPEAFERCDLAISIGGDGTFLYAARAGGTTPIMGVNLGEVGFLNAVPPDRAVEAASEAVSNLEDGTLSIRDVPRLRAECGNWSSEPAINEVLVQGPRRGAGADATVSISVDDSTYTREIADGVLVATPTGSTAYNLSEGGPLVHPAVDSMVVTPMFPRTGARPLVVDDGSTIELRVEDATSGYVVTDGRQAREFEAPFTATVEVSEEPLRIAGPDVNFFEALGKLE
ncbi:sugar kinase [Salinarchaeum sp. Harcht-Bsk1]|uniref:NAD(+)/NADH kinase n=1 Tax=Salinarchaeum sp. Harcht-Bsk1 TaxID=1333523 RepID=UPI00034241D3|nr:NAD(+)/NADH kinase [Salinarchaeum sp. Harcht-Bsk1]AGN02745.1 sugar kinase [Salinarchaeum sp. Harcht-Bsk1]